MLDALKLVAMVIGALCLGVVAVVIAAILLYNLWIGFVEVIGRVFYERIYERRWRGQETQLRRQIRELQAEVKALRARRDSAKIATPQAEPAKSGGEAHRRAINL